MNEETRKRIKELQNTTVLSQENRKRVKSEIVEIIRQCSSDEICDLLDNKTLVHSVVIQKGGVGKSTASSDICYTLAKMGFRVLGIDSDPQGSFTMLCNLDTEDENLFGLQDMYDAYFQAIEEKRPLEYKEIEKGIVRPMFRKPARNEAGKWEEVELEFGFDFIPSNLDLASFDILLARPGYAYVLRNILNLIQENRKYDFIIIDCLPGLNALSYNAIAAAWSGGSIVPINLEPMTVKGAKNLIETTSSIQHLFWEKGIVHKGIIGIIKNQYSPRMSIQRKYDDVVKELFPISTFDNFIPNKTVCDKAHSIGRFYSEYDPKTGEVMKEICYEIIAEDIRRNEEKEPLFVEDFGLQVWEKYN